MPFHIAPIAALPFGAGREGGRVRGVERGYAFEIAFVEKCHPLGVDGLDVGLLRGGRRDQPDKESDH
jgi:hypothetical protein